MTRKTQKPIPKEIAEGQPPESTPEPKSEPLPGLGGASPILKPSGFSLDGFRSKRSASIGGVATLPASLPIMRISEAKDYIRLHPNEAAYWSDELCFAHVPTKGVRGGSLLHLILEDLACAYLPEGKIIRHRLALATKPDDVPFLAEIPSTNLDNSWNASTLEGAEVGKTHWVQLTRCWAGTLQSRLRETPRCIPGAHLADAAIGRAYRRGVLTQPRHHVRKSSRVVAPDRGEATVEVNERLRADRRWRLRI
jgi:hypothetical protein